jgi:hypothetical protein
MSALLDSLLAVTPEEFEAMSPEEQDWVTAQLERETALRSPASFAVKHSNGAWLPYRHLVHTSDRIVAMLEDDTCDCLLVEQPVRHGKSQLCSTWTPAWFISKYHGRVILASYEGDFAATWGRKVRDIITDVGPTYGLRIDQSSRAANRWDLVGDDGGMVTAGASGPVTGKGGHLMIVDDPTKNREEADSPTMRQKQWEWWGEVFLSRREPWPVENPTGLAKVIVIMSRWHNDDLTGRIIATETDLRVAS